MKHSLFIIIVFSFLLSFSLACTTEENLPIKRIHLLNPWDDATPSIHGENIQNWGKVAMTQEEACGWFVYEHRGSTLGLFRFLKGEDWNADYGTGGEGSSANFNVDSLLATSDDVWIDTTRGAPVAEAIKPQVEGCGSNDVNTPEIPAAGNAAHPFPAQADYGRGALPQFTSWTHVQTIYELWRAEFWDESGDMARIEFDDRDSATAAETAAYTVSEGIGYGMLISVIMDNAQNDTRADFDKLWNYYVHFSNANGVMNWKTEGFTGVVEVNGATDGDLDVALALLIAYLQWGDAAYLEVAMTLIEAIRTHEVNADGFLKPGDMWDAARNPSYFSFVAFRYFAHFDAANSAFWENVIDVQYGLLSNASHGTTGLVPNWCDDNGAPVDPNNGYGPYYGHYGFDAIRAPWRAAWDYLWNGETRGQTFAGNIASWSDAKTGGVAANLRPIYTLSGDAVPEHNYTAQAAFTGATAVSCMMNDNHQAYLDALYAQLRNQAGDVSYYHTTLQVLYTALLTGNLPNYLNL